MHQKSSANRQRQEKLWTKNCSETKKDGEKLVGQRKIEIEIEIDRCSLQKDEIKMKILIAIACAKNVSAKPKKKKNGATSPTE